MALIAAGTFQYHILSIQLVILYLTSLLYIHISLPSIIAVRNTPVLI